MFPFVGAVTIFQYLLEMGSGNKIGQIISRLRTRLRCNSFGLMKEIIIDTDNTMSSTLDSPEKEDGWE